MTYVSDCKHVFTDYAGDGFGSLMEACINCKTTSNNCAPITDLGNPINLLGNDTPYICPSNITPTCDKPKPCPKGTSHIEGPDMCDLNDPDTMRYDRNYNVVCKDSKKVLNKNGTKCVAPSSPDSSVQSSSGIGKSSPPSSSSSSKANDSTKRLHIILTVAAIIALLLLLTIFFVMMKKHNKT